MGLSVISIIASTLLVTTSPVVKRRFRFKFVSYCNRAVLQWMKITCGVTFEINGLHNIPKNQPLVVACNHQSDWETFFLLTIGLPVSTVLKRELLFIPFFGWALAMLNPIAIDRKRKTNALKQLSQQGCERLNAGISVVIFPEGTRCPPGALGPCTKGAAMLAHQAGVPILPIVQNSGHLASQRQWLKPAGKIEVRIGQPISADVPTKEMHGQMVSWMTENLTKIS
ncbi:MAG: 1-acyl-sn-glycerol-3-phosphate acyltransferase [Oceanospirillaceae bacterium]|nr:1-acyl-sn-glycerol-3-phosphate acyltransferase [Oceanospirillaceae bacterium]